MAYDDVEWAKKDRATAKNCFTRKINFFKEALDQGGELAVLQDIYGEIGKAFQNVKFSHERYVDLLDHVLVSDVVIADANSYMSEVEREKRKVHNMLLKKRELEIKLQETKQSPFSGSKIQENKASPVSGSKTKPSSFISSKIRKTKPSSFCGSEIRETKPSPFRGSVYEYPNRNKMKDFKPPSFSGSHRDYPNFKANLEKLKVEFGKDAIILRWCLSGDALETVKGIGNDYDAMIKRLDDKYWISPTYSGSIYDYPTFKAKSERWKDNFGKDPIVLRQYLSGDALETVKGVENDYDLMVKRLDNNFKKSLQIVENALNDVKQIKVISKGDLKSFNSMVNKVEQCWLELKKENAETGYHSVYLVNHIETVLPQAQKFHWIKDSHDIFDDHLLFQRLIKFLRREKQVLQDFENLRHPKGTADEPSPSKTGGPTASLSGTSMASVSGTSTVSVPGTSTASAPGMPLHVKDSEIQVMNAQVGKPATQVLLSKTLPDKQLLVTQADKSTQQIQLVASHDQKIQLITMNLGSQNQNSAKVLPLPHHLQVVSSGGKESHQTFNLGLSSKSQLQGQTAVSQMQLIPQNQMPVVQRFILAPSSSHQYLNSSQVLTTTAPVVRSSTLGGAPVLGRVADKGAGKNDITEKAIPKIITGRLRPVQIVSPYSIICGKLPENIPVVDLKDEDLPGSSGKNTEVFQCLECPLLFDSKGELEQHESTHYGEANYVCDQCGKKFGIKISFDAHVMAHANEKKFECDVCSKRFDYRDNLIFHMRIHGDTKLLCMKCPVCHKKFKNKFTRDSHMKRHTIEEMSKCKSQYAKNIASRAAALQKKETFVCDVCSASFVDKVSLENHKVIHIKYERGPKMEVKKKSGTTGPSKHLCECGKVFTSEQLKGHYEVCEKRESNGVKCAFCKKHYNIAKQSKDDESQSLKFICEPCCNLLAQKSQVSGFAPRLENRFICNKCDKCFASESELRCHLQSHSTGKSLPTVRPFKCSQCKKMFVNKKAMEIHETYHAFEKKIAGKTTVLPDSEATQAPSSGGKKRKKRKKVIPYQSKARRRNEREAKLKRRMEVIKYMELKKQKIQDEAKPSVSRKRESSECSKEVDKNFSYAHMELESLYETKRRNAHMELESLYEAKRRKASEEEEDNNSNFRAFDDDDDSDSDWEESVANGKNCTVFNAAPSKGKVILASLSMPVTDIKEEKPDEYEELEVEIKQEKEDWEDFSEYADLEREIKQERGEAYIKDESITIKEESLFARDGDCFEDLPFPIKEEKLDEDHFAAREDFEFTPLGVPIKEEPRDT